MELSVVVAIIPTNQREVVEKKLQTLNVAGITVTRAKGYGEYTNTFARDWLSDQARVEVYAESARADAIAQAIIEVAHTGDTSDGIVMIMQVRKAFSIRTRSETIPNRTLQR